MKPKSTSAHSNKNSTNATTKSTVLKSLSSDADLNKGSTETKPSDLTEAKPSGLTHTKPPSLTQTKPSGLGLLGSYSDSDSNNSDG